MFSLAFSTGNIKHAYVIITTRQQAPETLKIREICPCATFPLAVSG